LPNIPLLAPSLKPCYLLIGCLYLRKTWFRPNSACVANPQTKCSTAIAKVFRSLPTWIQEPALEIRTDSSPFGSLKISPYQNSSLVGPGTLETLKQCRSPTNAAVIRHATPARTTKIRAQNYVLQPAVEASTSLPLTGFPALIMQSRPSQSRVYLTGFIRDLSLCAAHLNARFMRRL
jgi:hypothetical protein